MNNSLSSPVSASSQINAESARPARRWPRVALALVWLVAFTAWFHSFGLPNNLPAARWMIWTGLPFDLLDLLDPPAVANAAPWSWLFLAQRLPSLLIAAVIWAGAWGLGSLLLRGLRLRAEFDSVERCFFACCLGLSAVSLLMLGLGLLGAMSGWLLGGLLLVAVSVEITFSPRQSSLTNPTGLAPVARGSLHYPKLDKASHGDFPDKTSSTAPTSSAETCEPPGQARWGVAVLLCVVAPFVFCMLLGAMSPQTDFDVVEYHLGGPKEWFQQGHIARLPHNVYTSFPFLTEMLLLCGMVLRGDWESGALAGQAAVAGFVPLAALGLFATGRRWFSSTAGSLAALVWLTTPWAYRIAIVAYAEGGLACYLFAALAVGLRVVWGEGQESGDRRQEASANNSAGRTPHPHPHPTTEAAVPRARGEGTRHRLIALCGLLAGSAMACKYTGAVSVVVPLAVMISLRAVAAKEPMGLRVTPRAVNDETSERGGVSPLVLGRKPSLEEPGGLRHPAQKPLTLYRVRYMQAVLELALFGVGALLAVGPWLVKNAVETGNPVFPLAYSVFGGAGRDATMDAQWQQGHSAPPYRGVSHRLSDFIVKLTDVAANNDWHSALMFGLAPIAVLASWRRRVWTVWAFIGWQFLSWFVLTHHIDRFYVPMFPVVALLAGVGAAWLFSALNDSSGENFETNGLMGETEKKRKTSLALQASMGGGSLSRRTIWTRVASVFVVCVIGANVLYNVGVMMNLGGYNSGRTEMKAARETQLSRWYGAQKWIDDELAAGRLPHNLKVLCVGEAALFHARFPYVYNTVFDQSLFEQWFAKRTASGELQLRPVAEIRATLLQHRITHVLINWSEVLRYREPGSYGFTDFVHPDQISELVRLGVLQPVPLPTSVALQPLKGLRLRQVEEWAPALQSNVDGQPALIAIQLFE